MQIDDTNLIVSLLTYRWYPERKNINLENQYSQLASVVNILNFVSHHFSHGHCRHLFHPKNTAFLTNTIDQSNQLRRWTKKKQSNFWKVTLWLWSLERFSQQSLWFFSFYSILLHLVCLFPSYDMEETNFDKYKIKIISGNFNFCSNQKNGRFKNCIQINNSLGQIMKSVCLGCYVKK